MATLTNAQSLVFNNKIQQVLRLSNGNNLRPALLLLLPPRISSTDSITLWICLRTNNGRRTRPLLGSKIPSMVVVGIPGIVVVVVAVVAVVVDGLQIIPT